MTEMSKPIALCPDPVPKGAGEIRATRHEKALRRHQVAVCATTIVFVAIRPGKNLNGFDWHDFHPKSYSSSALPSASAW